MIYPTINDLTRGEYNRYEIALATAKCARMITNEYTRQRAEAERAMAGSKESGERPMTTMIDREVRDEKAVKLAIGRIFRGEYLIVHKDPAEQEREEQAILAGIHRRYEDEIPAFDLSVDEDEDETGDADEDADDMVEVEVYEAEDAGDEA